MPDESDDRDAHDDDGAPDAPVEGSTGDASDRSDTDSSPEDAPDRDDSPDDPPADGDSPDADDSAVDDSDVDDSAVGDPDADNSDVEASDVDDSAVDDSGDGDSSADVDSLGEAWSDSPADADESEDAEPLSEALSDDEPDEDSEPGASEEGTDDTDRVPFQETDGVETVDDADSSDEAGSNADEAGSNADDTDAGDVNDVARDWNAVTSDDAPTDEVAESADESDGAPDEGPDGLQEAASDDDEDTGGLQRVDRDEGVSGNERVEPRSRHVDERDDDFEDDDIEGDDFEVGPDADGELSVPDRGVEDGFEEPPEDRPSEPIPDHPDTVDSNGGSDVPVGHAAGAPRPGEATPAGAGAGAGANANTGTASGRRFEDDDELFDGPPDDEEMPLADHIEEMMLRLAAVVFAGAVATVLMYLYSDYFVIRMWNDILPAGTGGARPHLYAPLEFVLTKIKVASLAGILIALPVLVYQSYLFMRPGLYPQERRYYLAAVPTSLVLAAAGMAFAYFAVLPGLFQYFDYYTEGNAVIAYGLQSTFNLIVALMGLQAVVFQIPLFVMLAIMMGVTSREWLEGRRLLFWGAFGGIAFLFAPDPTGMAPFIIAVSMIVLFEGTLALLRWTGR